MKHVYLSLSITVLSLIGSFYAQGSELCVKNADSSACCLDKPAQRIVSLAPHLTEIAFASGAGAQLVGVVSYSDFPPAARTLPNLGGYHQPDMEKLIGLKPDLVLAWQSGAPPSVLATLKRLGIKVWISRGEHIEDVPHELRSMGLVSGHPDDGQKAADAFEHELNLITQKYANARPVRGFFQIWPQPLVSVSDSHFIAEAMRRCGIENIVGKASSSTPTWSDEAVIRARPELIMSAEPARDFTRWQRWPELPAVQNHALIILPPDVLTRPGPRLLEGIRALCAAADKVRAASIEKP